MDGIPEQNFKDQVEIIGWMYQYYISEEKYRVFEGLKQNIKITKENIPAATQLFTPDWIVKYMVENSLGRLWLEGHPNDDLKSKWKYYIEEAEQEPEVRKQLDELRAKRKDIKPEDIKVLDPAVGSGHILVYAFDVLYEIYKSAGYSEIDIPRLILENNLYGLDIDDRAAQLACFAIMMKARSKSGRIFREKINLNICAIQESNGFPEEVIDYLVNKNETDTENGINREDAEYLIKVFHDAREYGSVLKVKPIDFNAIEKRLKEIKSGETQDLFEYQWGNIIHHNRKIILEKIPVLIKQAKIMSQKYDVVCTNPPYMGSKGMNYKLSEFLRNNYPDGKSDLFAAFMETQYTKQDGISAMINQQSWMFLSSFEKIREKIIISKNIINMIHLGARAFEEIAGEVVQSTAFVLRNRCIKKYRSVFIRLVDIKEPQEKEKVMLSAKNRDNDLYYVAVPDNFKSVPGMPIAYWISDKVIDCFNKGKPLGEIAKIRQGMATADNDRFLRIWYEVNFEKIGFNMPNSEAARLSRYKWFPYNKGGDFRKWYGNNEYVVNWESDGQEIKNYEPSVIRNPGYYFKKGITWSFVGSSYFGVRYSGGGFIFDVGGSSVFPPEKYHLFLTGLLCSKIAEMLMKVINPTLNFQVGNVALLPVILPDDNTISKINMLVSENIRISRNDWDSFETSWDFQRHPLLIHKGNSATIEQAFNNWAAFAEKRFKRLKANEEELNRIFIEIYDLQGELAPELEERDITVRKADRVRDIKSFISYAVGCMFGRYSIDAEGLVYAGGNFKDRWKYEDSRWKVRKTAKDEDGKIVEDVWVDATFAPDMDNVLPIADDEYFEDDIVSKFIEFIKVTFGEESLEKNLNYIADVINRKTYETARQAIRRYFLRNFYKDHVKMYRKRPVYWLFDSGKQNGFKALVYMHRYDEFTLARVRADYLHKLQKSLEVENKRLDNIMDSDASPMEKTNAGKKREKILKQIEECSRYDRLIAHVAEQRIKIDLDDGVKVNYARFQSVEIPQGEGQKPLKADLLAKI